MTSIKSEEINVNLRNKTKDKVLSSERLDVAFIGCVSFSEETLKCLLSLSSERINICAVVSKSQSHINDDHVDLLPRAKKHKIPHLDYQNTPELLENFLAKHKPDVIYCFGWSHLIPKSILNIARYGAIGFHPTQLPLHRGRHPIIWTLALGLTETATTFFQMEQGADTGAIIHQENLEVLLSDTASTLYEKIISQALRQIPMFTRQLRDGDAVFIEQDETKSSEWRKRGFRDGIIDWRMSAISIYNLIRALTKPYCGAQFACKEQFIIIWRAEIPQPSSDEFNADITFEEPGKILAIDEYSMLIQCGDNSTILVGKTPDFPTLNIGEFL